MNDVLKGKINGFLEAVALINSSFDLNVGYGFYFEEIESNGEICKSISEHILSEYRNYLVANKRKEDKELLNNLENNFSLLKVFNWDLFLKEGLADWFLSTPLKNYQSYERTVIHKRVYDSLNITTSEFINLIKEFFDKDEEFEVWEFDEYFKNSLFYFWGGLRYLDYVFTCKEKVFILHLDVID